MEPTASAVESPVSASDIVLEYCTAALLVGEDTLASINDTPDL